MNPRFDCFVWNNWSNTELYTCITAYNAELEAFEASTSRIGFVNTGTGGYRNRCPRGAGACVSANRGRRARWGALCGRLGVLAGEGVAA